MRTKDLEVNKEYRAKLDYGVHGRVVVLRTAIPRQARHASRTTNDGTLVKTIGEIGRPWGGNPVAAGTELIIPASYIEREWTPEDQVKADILQSNRDRAARIEAAFEARGIEVAEGFALGLAEARVVSAKAVVEISFDAIEKLLELVAEPTV